MAAAEDWPPAPRPRICHRHKVAGGWGAGGEIEGDASEGIQLDAWIQAIVSPR